MARYGKRRSGWAVIGMLVLAMLSAHLFSFGLEARIPDYLRNALHAPSFAVLAVLLQRLLRSRMGRRWSYAGAAGAALAMGVLGEIAQMFGHRDADFGDLAIDGLGIVTGLAIRASLDRSLTRVMGPLFRTGVAILALAGTAAVVHPFVRYAQVVRERAAVLPALLQFEQPWEAILYTSSSRAGPVKRVTPPGWPAPGRWVAEMVLDRPRTPGLKLYDPYPDWTGYRAFSFVAAAAGDETRELVVRIHDDHHDYRSVDRFHQRILVTPEPRRYRIELDAVREAPEGREMDLSSIDAVIVYDPDPEGGERVLIDDLRLEP